MTRTRYKRCITYSTHRLPPRLRLFNVASIHDYCSIHAPLHSLSLVTIPEIPGILPLLFTLGFMCITTSNTAGGSGCQNPRFSRFTSCTASYAYSFYRTRVCETFDKRLCIDTTAPVDVCVPMTARTKSKWIGQIVDRLRALWNLGVVCAGIEAR